MIAMPDAIAVLSFASIVTAAIIKFVPKRDESNGKYVTYREYAAAIRVLHDRMDDLKRDIKDGFADIKSRL